MSRSLGLLFACLLAFGLVVCSEHRASAQFGGGGGFGFQGVGGISIDAEGIVRNLDPKVLESLAAERKPVVGKGLVESSELRKVSLAKVVAAVAKSIETGKSLSTDVLLFGGLSRITHVFVDPDGKDIILAGPAERIVVAADGTFVGAESQRPLLCLEDFIVSLQAIDGARQGGIQCSIDPTPEGIAKFQALMARQQTMSRNPEDTFRNMEEAFGLQTVRVGGVPASSRFAHVLVAADYRMKRIGIGEEKSGVAALPSYLSMVPPGAKATSLPRFWLEAEYDPISRDADELAWQINGRRMKCVTESDIVGREGVQRGAGRRDGIAEKWCESMTKHYDELSAKQPIFAELVNCVDLAVVSALIHGRQLDKRAGLDLSVLLNAKMPSYAVPEEIPAMATGLKKGNNWVLASGGIQFQPWQFATATRDVPELAESRTAAVSSRKDDGWYW